MNRFLQIHILTAYPPSNPNRDDLGRPKTAIIGGVTRMRISSQALKRAMRMSDVFQSALAGNLGERTQRIGEEVRKHLIDKGESEERALEIARKIAGKFGKIKGEKDKHPAFIDQLAFVSPEERAAAFYFADRIRSGEEEGNLDILQKADGAVDIAMFGRMLAGNPDFNRDAAVQVAHAFTTNRVDIEDDYYTAVDDLKTTEEDAGAGFIGEAGFGAGVFYLYICVDCALLLKNLRGDEKLAGNALAALVRAAATASPSGKKNSYANHVRAEYMLLEYGDAQPRSLASAFIKPVTGTDQLAASIQGLGNKRKAFAKTYGQDWVTDIELYVDAANKATLDELAAFASQGLEGSA